MIDRLQRIQYFSQNIKIIFSIFIIAIVTYLHVMTTPSIEMEISLPIDKIAHAILFYFVGLWFFLIAREDQLVSLLILLCICAFSMELLQMNLAYRSFEWLDWLADVFGILLSFFHLFKKL